jgi:hypothetical protein
MKDEPRQRSIQMFGDRVDSMSSSLQTSHRSRSGDLVLHQLNQRTR